MGLVVIDTDVLALHHVFTWDKRYNIIGSSLKWWKNQQLLFIIS